MKLNGAAPEDGNRVTWPSFIPLQGGLTGVYVEAMGEPMPTTGSTGIVPVQPAADTKLIE